MALTSYDNLGEMTTAVLKRCGLGGQPNLVTDVVPQVEEYIRAAQLDLWNSYQFLRQRTRMSVALVTGQTLYPIPDGLDAGSIWRITASSADGKIQWDLDGGILTYDRTTAALQNPTFIYEPSRYQLRDGCIEVLQAPTAMVTLLNIDAVLGPARLIQTTDIPTVDSEAIVRIATIALKGFKGIPMSPTDLPMLQSYIAGCAGRNRSQRNIAMGTGWVDPTEVPTGRMRQRPWWLADRRP